MARAYILIQTEVGRAEEARGAMSAIAGVRQVDIVAGEADLIAIVEKPTPQELGQTVMREIHGLPGIAATTTFVVIS